MFKLLSISVLRVLCCCVRFQLVVCASWQGGMKRGCVINHIPYALKGQKLLAQGSALGIIAINKTPCFTLIEQALSVFFNVNYI